MGPSLLAHLLNLNSTFLPFIILPEKRLHSSHFRIFQIVR